ncbi:hypothetical protein [Hymenobacter chitinivorans]|uniref:Uncharacterized protein n=1 Tax=Hymenobacter chitinivorans DSM 11115 TaxID=1121954 RepID=A0A2M9BSS7_9BACT|nr:hypothetical protein [Hymenobacter chitinivorans]PJJ61005.1 hypothetical protein CLV45_2442 [Hymenobacter chitinivorans DSM 11115]
MEPDYSFLTTQAECDDATAEVTFELKTFTHIDSGLDLADDRADRSKASGAAALAKKDAEILRAQGEVNAAGLTNLQRQDAIDALELLQAQRKKILKNNRVSAGTNRFLGSVNGVQTQAQVTVLTGVLAGIAGHRATLSA